MNYRFICFDGVSKCEFFYFFTQFSIKLVTSVMIFVVEVEHFPSSITLSA